MQIHPGFEGAIYPAQQEREQVIPTVGSNIVKPPMVPMPGAYRNGFCPYNKNGIIPTTAETTVRNTRPGISSYHPSV